MAERKKPSKPLVWKCYDYPAGSPGMISGGVRIDAEGNIKAKSEMSRDFDVELEQLERRLNENLVELGYPQSLTSTDPRRENKWGSPLDHLWAIKRTIYFIHKHKGEGDDISPLAFDLGLQVGKARAVAALSENRSARGKRSGKKRKEALARLKAKAQEAFDDHLEQYPGFGEREGAYRSAARDVGRNTRTVRRWLTGK